MGLVAKSQWNKANKRFAVNAINDLQRLTKLIFIIKDLKKLWRNGKKRKTY